MSEWGRERDGPSKGGSLNNKRSFWGFSPWVDAVVLSHDAVPIDNLKSQISSSLTKCREKYLHI